MEEIKQLEEAEQIFKLPNSWKEKGIQEGKIEEKRQIAYDMLKEGLSIDLIEKITKLGRNEIEEIMKTL